MTSFNHFVISLITTAVAMSSAIAAELATKLAISDIHRSEQIIATAVRVGDRAELKRQTGELARLFPQIPSTEDAGTRIVCANALQSLRNLADDLAGDDQARKALLAQTSRRDYLEQMPQCEARAGSKPPSRPNLRR